MRVNMLLVLAVLAGLGGTTFGQSVQRDQDISITDVLKAAKENARSVPGVAAVAAVQRKAAPDHRPISVGDRVVDPEGHVGTVTMVFPDGDAKVDFDGYWGWGQVILSIKKLSRSVDRLGGIRVGDRVIEPEDHVGTVKMIFSNGDARVDLDGYFGQVTFGVKDLSKSADCVKDICVGDRVVDSDDHVKMGQGTRVQVDGQDQALGVP